MGHIIKYLCVLTTLTLTAGVGYFFALENLDYLWSLIYVAVFYMPTPFYALLITSAIQRRPLKLSQYGTLKSIRIKHVGLAIGMFVSWVAAFAVLSVAASAIAPEAFGTFALTAQGIEANMVQQFGAEVIESTNNPPPPVPVFIIVGLIAAIGSGFTINLLFALGEEYGWRGYLRKKLRGSFLKKYSIIGTLWGVWHAPLILQGYNYGTEYALAGTFLFVAFCLIFGYLFGILMEKTNNILYAGALHGMFNGFAGIFPVLLGSYNPLLAGPVGILSILAFAAVAILFYLFTHLAKQPSPAPQPGL